MAMLAVSIAVVWAQSDSHPEILVLGTYHMSNPGRDIYNMQADDVLSPKRQQEMAQLIEVLKKFHPTKIAIEAESGSPRVERNIPTMSRESTRCRVTKSIRSDTGWPRSLAIMRSTRSMRRVISRWQRVVNYAKANGRNEKLDAITAGWGTMVKEEDEFLRIAHRARDVGAHEYRFEDGKRHGLVFRHSAIRRSFRLCRT